DLLVHVVHDALHVELGERADQAALEPRSEVEDLGEDGGERALRGVARIDNIEGPLREASFLIRQDRSAPFSSREGGGADVVDVDGVNAEILGPEPLHLLAFALVHFRQTQAACEKAHVVGPIDVAKSEDSIPQSCAFAQLLEFFFGGEFVCG
ncbi:MAG: hypothetical protein Q9193_007207, partial [Seirophora villosa]